MVVAAKALLFRRLPGSRFGRRSGKLAALVELPLSSNVYHAADGSRTPERLARHGVQEAGDCVC
eukprot:3147394-Amphidinium_carterae.1